jgi:predicted RNase H-like nuclease
MKVLGADGCRAGWVVASRHGVEVLDRLDRIVADATVAVVGVDMPIGLPRVWGRDADRQARQLLGRPRASSVFPTPPRSLITATTYATANQRSWSELGRGLTRQTYHLFERIKEVDALVRAAMDAASEPGDRLVEVHPECSFRVMAGRHLPSKHTADGIARRRALLLPRFGPVVDDRPRGAAADDVLDAYAVLWSAERFARGGHLTLGDGSVDELGLPMRIVT